MAGFHTVTFGCKLNQFDTAAIEGELARRGFAPQPEPALAEVVILNTCTVTHRADADARKYVRRIRRANPSCKLLVTGCYAERDAAAVEAVTGVDRVFGNREKPRLSSILDDLGLFGPGDAGQDFSDLGDRGCDGGAPDGGFDALLPRALHFGERSRAFLKIQDGCRLACSYCIIPTVRGPSRSVAPSEVEEAVRALVAEGYREVVLTGINTGDYGRDLAEPVDLVTLLRRLLPGAAPARLRLNSLEPLTVTDGVIALIASEPALAPHLQIPLQSGSDTVLRGMRRNYRAAQWLERVEHFRTAVPDACIGADVIVGFPGESDALFAETLELLERSPVDYLHVFSWSARPGTPAATFAETVHDATIVERSAALRAFSARRRQRFHQRFVGRERDAVVLGAASGRAEHTRALTDNYIEVLLPENCGPRGARRSVRIERVKGEAVWGRLGDGPGNLRRDLSTFSRA